MESRYLFIDSPAPDNASNVRAIVENVLKDANIDYATGYILGETQTLGNYSSNKSGPSKTKTGYLFEVRYDLWPEIKKLPKNVYLLTAQEAMDLFDDTEEVV